jgi:hypothetical protein
VSAVGQSEQSHVINPVPWFDHLGPLIPTLSDLAFLLPVLVLFWATTGVGWLLTDSDTGWHIRTGQWILSNDRIPKEDMFSFTMDGRPWVAWEWLSDVAMAIAHRMGGLAGVTWLAMLVLGITSACVYKAVREECGHGLIAIGLTWLAMSASTVHWLARPHLVTPLMTAIFCRTLNRIEREGNSTRLWSLPLLTILWTNLHGGFFVGIALICTYALGASIEELLRGSRRNAWLRSRKYVLTALACLLASLLNPYGYRLHIHVAQYLGSSFYFARISEFQSIDFHSFTAAYFETLLMLAIAAAWHLRSGRLIHALLLLSWSHLALFSARNIPIFAVAVVPGVGLAIRDWLGACEWPTGFKASVEDLESGLRLLAQRFRPNSWHLTPYFGALVLAMLFTHPGHRKQLQAAFDDSRFPIDAATFLSQQHGLSSIRLYASWQWGGYLIYRLWPSLRVFDDGRTDFYGSAFVEEGLRAWNGNPQWSSVFDRYGVNAALVPFDSALACILKEKREWRPIYHDHLAILFAKIEEEQRVPMPNTNEIPIAETVNASSTPNSDKSNDNSTAPGGFMEIRSAVRRRLPDERHSLTHHFSIGGQEGYVTVGLYEDGAPGEMFIRMAKEGSTVSGLMDSFATAVSLALQYGVPLKVLCDKFSHTRFEPSGWSGNPKIGYAKSLMDYLFRWLELRFLKGEQGILFELSNGKEPQTETGNAAKALSEIVSLGDAPTCQFCGSLMVRNGSCYRCLECGSTSGCS